MTNYTPGPWSRFADRVVTDPANGAGSSRMIDCGFSGIDRDTDIANASLIAAAPDMLAALIDLVGNGFSDEELSARWKWRIEAIKAARAAIAKAEGREG